MEPKDEQVNSELRILLQLNSNKIIIIIIIIIITIDIEENVIIS